MEFKSILFYVFSVIMLISAFRVITARNPVHAVLFLVLTFASAAAIWLLLQAEFLAIVLVLVYVGAVMVLFLFVVMMLDINLDQVRKGFWSHFPLAAIVGLIAIAELSSVVINNYLSIDDSFVPDNAAMLGDTKALGKVIFTEYVYGFEIAAVILLVAIIAAVVLTVRHRKDVKHIEVSDAIKVKSSDRLRIIKMASEPKEDIEVAAVQEAAATKGKE